MYAVIKDGGREFKVEEGDEVLLDRKELEPGSTYSFTDILLVSDGQNTLVGKPVLGEASVTAKVIGEVKGKKVIAFKYRRRKNSKTKKGHRQKYTKVEITSITAQGIEAPAKAKDDAAEGAENGA
ncbi:MAG: 50S ribosomal protein L21 [Planctomycetota bacterium]|jgi:large subunit ribosomal protein L21